MKYHFLPPFSSHENPIVVGTELSAPRDNRKRNQSLRTYENIIEKGFSNGKFRVIKIFTFSFFYEKSFQSDTIRKCDTWVGKKKENEVKWWTETMSRGSEKRRKEFNSSEPKCGWKNNSNFDTWVTAKSILWSAWEGKHTEFSAFAYTLSLEDSINTFGKSKKISRTFLSPQLFHFQSICLWLLFLLGWVDGRRDCCCCRNSCAGWIWGNRKFHLTFLTTSFSTFTSISFNLSALWRRPWCDRRAVCRCSRNRWHFRCDDVDIARLLFHFTWPCRRVPFDGGRWRFYLFSTTTARGWRRLYRRYGGLWGCLVTVIWNRFSTTPLRLTSDDDLANAGSVLLGKSWSIFTWRWFKIDCWLIILFNSFVIRLPSLPLSFDFFRMSPLGRVGVDSRRCCGRCLLLLMMCFVHTNEIVPPTRRRHRNILFYISGHLLT